MEIVMFGATGGIGRALAHALQGQGRLWLTGRNTTALRELAHALGAEAEPLDLADEEAVRAFLEKVGPVDRLFYAAGAVVPIFLRDLDRSAWERTFTANVWGAFLALKHTQWRSGARGVFLGAYPQRIAFPKLGAYAASKWALEGLLTVARRELRGVHLTLVRLPAVATSIWAPFGGPPKGAWTPEEAAQRILEGIAQEPPPEILEL